MSEEAYEMMDFESLLSAYICKVQDIDLLKSEINRRARDEIACLNQRAAKLAELVEEKDAVPPVAAEPARKERQTGKPKYRHPDFPEFTWTGTGRKPKWVVQLIEIGHRLEDFAIPD